MFTNLPPPVPPTSTETLQADVYCVNCGNPLRGYRLDLNCSACATPVYVSIAQPPLADASPAYLKALAHGLLLVPAAFITSIIFGIGNLVLTLMYPSMLVTIVSQIIGLAITMMQQYGYWQLSNPGLDQDDYPEMKNVIGMIRRMTGAIVALTLVSTPFAMIWVVIQPQRSFFQPPSGNPGPMWPVAILSLIGLATLTLVVIRFVHVMRLFRWIATRACDEGLIRQTKYYVWLLPVLSSVGACMLGLGPLAAMIMYIVMLFQVRQHVVTALRAGGGSPSGMFGPPR